MPPRLPRVISACAYCAPIAAGLLLRAPPSVLPPESFDLPCCVRLPAIFVPRLVELFVTGALDRSIEPAALVALKNADLALADRLFVEAQLLAWWRSLLSAPVAAPAEAVRKLREAGLPLPPFASAWVDLPGEPPARHLAAYVWNRFSEAERWLPLDAVTERLERAFFQASSAQVERELSRSLDAVSVIDHAFRRLTE